MPMDFEIVTDSSSNLVEEMIDDFGLHVLPLTFMEDGEEYQSYLKGQHTDLKQFYTMMREGKVITTSLPNLAESEALMRGLRREVEEEVEVERELSLVPVGVINEETNEVGSVHLGFMFRMEVTGEVRVRETEKLEGLWVPKSELPALREQLEGWSKIAMEAIV